jgi:glyoxylase-like metal-dependent hydrolase (beta-lactamase superfamily II)
MAGGRDERGGEMADDHGTAVAIGDGLWLLDLRFLGEPNVVAAYLMAGNGELALIETGPSSTLPALRAGLRAAGFGPEELTAILVTHIHLDHAGAAGVLLRECPKATVYVHPIGAPHMVDPSKLLASATRIYGDQMDRLWGEVLPIPTERLVSLEDGVPVSVAGRVLTPIFTPGHASHHVAYWDAAHGTAFTGDGGGIRMPGTGYVCPPTPPPDLDPAAWAVSADRLRALGARRLCLTHFGPFDDAEAHLAALIPELDVFVGLARTALQRGADQAELTRLIHDRMVAQLGPVPEATPRQLELATPSYMAALGLTRYLTKRGEVPGS